MTDLAVGVLTFLGILAFLFAIKADRPGSFVVYAVAASVILGIVVGNLA